MAYAALASLARAIDQILPHDPDFAFLCGKEEMKSLHEKVVLLQEHLDYVSVQSFSPTADDHDSQGSQIRDVAYQLEDIIESIMCRSVGQEFKRDMQLLTLRLFSSCVEKVGVLLKKVTKMKKKIETKKNIPRALASLARAIDQILSQDEVYAFLCEQEQVKSLQDKVISLQKVLGNISGQSHSSTIDVPETRIINVVYKLDDIMESLRCKSSLGQEFESDFDSEEFFRCFDEVDVLLAKAMKVEENLKSQNISGALWQLPTTSSAAEAPSAEGAIVGIDDDLNQILDQITGEEPNLTIIPITGMGGIGKTTLARAVYEHLTTVNHFDIRVWVTVSGDYCVEDIFRGILSAKQQREESNEKLFDSVYRRLIGQRYLIVLDDVWDSKVWDLVKRALPHDKNRSRVIITTRVLEVAKYFSASSVIHEMQFLNEEHSWDLLRVKVYGQEHLVEFEDIGRTISKNCKGLPLAIVVTAGLLKFNKTRKYWKDVAKNTNAEAATDYDRLFGILSLSYTNLPPHLKACFLHMGAFPEDYAIRTKELVMIWSAEGFLRKPKESKGEEEVAEGCLEELVERSLVLVRKKGYNGKIVKSSVHDVLREVCLRKAQEDKFLHYFTDKDTSEVAFQKIIEVQRRVSFSSKLLNFPYDTYDTFARSILIKSPVSWITNHLMIEMYSQWLSMILRFQLLRVLDGMYLKDTSSLSTLFKLTNLRYLHFVHKESLNVPESISNLQNLETLIFSGFIIRGGGQCVLHLPMEIWKMPHLRHLAFTRKTSLPFPVVNQGYPILENLHTLSWITNFSFNESVIKKVPNLKKLSLDYMIMTSDDMKYFHLDALVHLHQLEELAVCGETSSPSIPNTPTPIRNYAFPLNLKKLTLEETRIPWSKMSIVGSLPSLEKLKLKWGSVIGRHWVLNKGEFVRLKYLKMEKLLIDEWIAESEHFPCLETLIIVSCITLENVPLGIGEIETLQKLTLKNCKPAEESVIAIKECLLDYGNTMLQVDISCDSYVPEILYDPEDPNSWHDHQWGSPQV